MTDPGKGIIARMGYFSSISLLIITLLTFGMAMTAIPKSGPFCIGDCISYPFTESLKFYPGDYYWMYLAILQLIIWIIYMISLHFSSIDEKKMFSFLSIAFALMSVIILSVDYFLQLTAVPASLMKGETEGIALITQYNDHGLFIAMEELGYFFMSLSFLFMAFVFPMRGSLERWLRLILLLPFVLTLFSTFYYSIKFGTDRSYRLEIALITINWLTMIVLGILTAILFRQKKITADSI